MDHTAWWFICVSVHKQIDRSLGIFAFIRSYVDQRLLQPLSDIRPVYWSRLSIRPSPPFVGSKKATLRRVLREKGVPLTAEAQASLDALPERFMDFIAAPERFFARPEAKAA